MLYSSNFNVEKWFQWGCFSQWIMTMLSAEYIWSLIRAVFKERPFEGPLWADRHVCSSKPCSVIELHSSVWTSLSVLRTPKILIVPQNTITSFLFKHVQYMHQHTNWNAMCVCDSMFGWISQSLSWTCSVYISPQIHVVANFVYFGSQVWRNYANTLKWV